MEVSSSLIRCVASLASDFLKEPFDVDQSTLTFIDIFSVILERLGFLLFPS